jgi:protein-L-isoaspartate(D-aspartate) O-methyltransferase
MKHGAVPSDGARTALLRRLRAVVRDARVLDVMSRIPREWFVPPEWEEAAWENRPLPIGCGQTISQPEIVAVMTEALNLRGDERVLELGTGSGYQTAVLAGLAREVVSVERMPALADRARGLLAGLGYTNVLVEGAGPVLGAPQHAPFEAIIVTAGAPDVPPELVDQLTPHGRLVIPIGSRAEQDLVCVVRRGERDAELEYLGPCRFVPLVGPGAWPEGTE